MNVTGNQWHIQVHHASTHQNESAWNTSSIIQQIYRTIRCVDSFSCNRLPPPLVPSIPRVSAATPFTCRPKAKGRREVGRGLVSLSLPPFPFSCQGSQAHTPLQDSRQPGECSVLSCCVTDASLPALMTSANISQIFQSFSSHRSQFYSSAIFAFFCRRYSARGTLRAN